MKILKSHYTEEYRKWAYAIPFGSKMPKEMIMYNFSWENFSDKQIGECCGSNISTPEDFLSCVSGVNICFTKNKIDLPEDTELYSYHQVYGDCEWINIMLYHGTEILSLVCGIDCRDTYGNIYNLYSKNLIINKNNWPDGVYLMILTILQNQDNYISLAEKQGLVVEWKSPTFANHNYSDDPDRLTMYVLRKGERK